MCIRGFNLLSICSSKSSVLLCSYEMESCVDRLASEGRDVRHHCLKQEQPESSTIRTSTSTPDYVSSGSGSVCSLSMVSFTSYVQQY